MSGTKSFSPDQVQLYIGTPPDDLDGTMTVLMKTNRYYTDGSLKQAKNSYTVTREWGRTAVEAGWAADAGNVLPVQDSPGFQEGSIAALQALVSPDGILLPDSSPIVFQGDRGIPYIVSGLTLPASGTIGVASITAGVAYVGGMRRAIAGQVLALTASRDNYVDVNQLGQLVISTVTLGAAAPALAVDSLRLGKVATDATSVTSRQITGADSLGNWMGNYVSVPYCRHVFSPSTVYTAGDRALAFGTSSTSYDNVNMHSESTQNTRFTVPTSGLYYVMGVIILASGATTSQWNAKIFKNGASASLGTMSADAATVLTQRAGGIVEAAAGDYFEMFLTNSVTVTQAAAAMQVARIA